MPIGPWRKLTRKLGLPPIDNKLVQQAFAHGSYVREQGLPQAASNQRLEFLGDAVLDLIVAEELFRLHPDLPEGELTRRKAALVCAPALAEVASELGLGEHLLLGRGEEDSGGREKQSLLAEALEALVGAIFVAEGLDLAREFVLAKVNIALAEAQCSRLDSKSRLQELLQSRVKRLPEYVLTAADGPAHHRQFAVEARVGQVVIGRGVGTSKRQAEQQAAAEALDRCESWLAELRPRASEGTRR
jgi:ribonuclease-3